MHSLQLQGRSHTTTFHSRIISLISGLSCFRFSASGMNDWMMPSFDGGTEVSTNRTSCSFVVSLIGFLPIVSCVVVWHPPVQCCHFRSKLGSMNRFNYFRLRVRQYILINSRFEYLLLLLSSGGFSTSEDIFFFALFFFACRLLLLERRHCYWPFQAGHVYPLHRNQHIHH
jgi:hypothetical protein